MAKGFTAPIAGGVQMRHGKANRPKRTREPGASHLPPRDYPITDSFASRTVPQNRPGDRAGHQHSYESKRPKSPSRGSGRHA